MDLLNCIFCYEKNTNTRSSITADFENENKKDLILINFLPSLLDIPQNTSLQFNQAFFGFNQLDFICKKCQILIEDGGKILEKIKQLNGEFEELKCKFKKLIEKNAKLGFAIEINDNENSFMRKDAGVKGRKIILNELGYLKEDSIKDNEHNSDKEEDDDLTDYDDDFQMEIREEEKNSPSVENVDLPQSPQIKEEKETIDPFQRRSSRSCSQKAKIKIKSYSKKPKKEKQEKIKINLKRDLESNKINFRFEYPQNEDWTICKPCQKPFIAKRLYFSHKFNFHGGPKYFKCSFCDEFFGTHQILTNHKAKVHYGNQPKLFPCNLCERKLSSNLQLRKHFSRSHSKTSREKVKCKFCDQTFLDLENLKKHEEGHENPLLCIFCGSEYFTDNSLKAHIKNAHSDQPKKFECNLCNYKTNIFANFQTHKNFHDGIKNFFCESCGSGYTTKSNLNAHIKRNHVPEDEKEFKCEHCPKRFGIKKDLEIHLLFHKSLTDRPWKCTHENCSKSFIGKARLKAHESTHLNLRQIICDICSKSFNDAKHLYSHKYYAHKIKNN